jgi:hypothetical protein
VHDPTDPFGRPLFNALAMIAEFEADLTRLRTREGMKAAKAKGRLHGKQPKLTRARKPTSSSCTKPGSTRAPSSPSCSTSPGPRSIAHLPAPERRPDRNRALPCTSGQLRESWAVDERRALDALECEHGTSRTFCDLCGRDRSDVDLTHRNRFAHLRLLVDERTGDQLVVCADDRQGIRSWVGRLRGVVKPAARRRVACWQPLGPVPVSARREEPSTPRG